MRSGTTCSSSAEGWPGCGGRGRRPGTATWRWSRRSIPVRSHSVAAQGGINAALGRSPRRPRRLARAARLRHHQGERLPGRPVGGSKMCERAETIDELDHWGARSAVSRTARSPSGPSAAPGSPGPATPPTGPATSCCRRCTSRRCGSGVSVYEEWALARDGRRRRAAGATAWSPDDPQPEDSRPVSPPRYCVLATGGYGRIYRNSTNAYQHRQRDRRCAYLAGVPLKDMEFVQFHPDHAVRHQHPDHRSCPRRRRLPGQPRRGAVHGALRTNIERPCPPGHRGTVHRDRDRRRERIRGRIRPPRPPPPRPA